MTVVFGPKSISTVILSAVLTVLLALALALWAIGFGVSHRFSDDDDTGLNGYDRMSIMYFVVVAVSIIATIIALWIHILFGLGRGVSSYIHFVLLLWAIFFTIAAFATYAPSLRIDECSDLPEDQDDVCRGDKIIWATTFFLFFIWSIHLPLAILLLINKHPHLHQRKKVVVVEK